jgi:protein SCO1/2
MDQGKYLFHTHCAACHTIGHGESIGPDLKGVNAIRDPKWLQRIVQAPDLLLAEHDPLATALFVKYKGVRMPNLHLDGEAAQLLIKYMAAQNADLNTPAAGESKQELPR